MYVRTKEQMATDTAAAKRLVELVEAGEVVQLVTDDPGCAGVTRTYLRGGPGERAGFWVVDGPDHQATKLGPSNLRGYIGGDVRRGWHEPATPE